MAVDLSMPFRLRPDGREATIDQSSTDYQEQLVAALIATRPGERPLVPTFGIEDPAFHGLDRGELAAQLQVFGPPVTIEDVRMTPIGQHTARIEVTFS